VYNIFFLATLISSIGSMACNLAAGIYMVKAGHPLVFAGVTLAFARYSSIFANLVAPSITKRLSSKETVLIFESISLVLSILLMYLWQGSKDSITFFVGVYVVRSFCSAVPSGARAGFTKEISKNSLVDNTRTATLLNKATQGAALFAGFVIFFAYKQLSFDWIIGFDALTFLLSSIAFYWMMQKENKISEPKNAPRVSFFEGFKAYFSLDKRLVIEDILWAATGSGATIYAIRLVQDNQSLVPLVMSLYGLAVWIGGFLTNKLSKVNSAYIWTACGIAFVCLSFASLHLYILLFFVLLKDVFRWTVLHRLSGKIQFAASQQEFSSMFSSRQVLLGIVFASGEWIFGALNTYVSISTDCIFRGLLCAIAACTIWLFQTKKGKTCVDS